MFFKRTGKTIFGVQFTSSEKKAMNEEINKQLAVATEKHEQEVEAILLWGLHEELGFGKKRMKRLYKKISKMLKELEERYEESEYKDAHLCTRKLKEYGVDLEIWRNEGIDTVE